MQFIASKDCESVAVDPRYKTLKPVVTTGWSKREHRLLILLERPDPEDIAQHKLMSDGQGSGRDAVVNASTNSIRAIVKMAMQENRNAENDHGFGVSVFSSSTWQSAVEHLKPTKVLLCGFKCGSFILPDDPHLRYKQGNPVESNGIQFCQTLPVDQLLYTKDDDDADSSRSDLLYMVQRALSNLVRGRNPESLADLQVKPVVVDTIEKARALFAKLEASEEFSLDLETNNLSTYHNKVLTTQFSIDPAVGYLLPIQHPNTPFDKAEQLEIRKMYRRLMSSKTRKLVYLFNGKFDLRILRYYLKLPVIDHDVWEVTAGEHSLDENVGLLDRYTFSGLSGESVKTKFGNLRNLTCLYGNDFYYTAVFSKEQRNTISHIDIMTNVPAQEYCSGDAQFTLAIGRMQRQRAKRMKVFLNGELVKFSAMYERHVIHQMGVTAKTLSTMEEYGTFVDMPYMKELQDPKLSKLVPLLGVLKKRLLALPSIKDAEKVIDKASGVASKGLFSVSAVTSVFKITPRHLGILFFDVLKLKPLRRTKTGAPSADKDFLAEHRDTLEEADILAEYSEASKLLNTYVGSWNESIDEDMDGHVDLCLRPSFGFFSVVTGRLSSFDPNLQNVPTRGKLAKLIKRMFVSPKGHLSPRWDFSAHEVRMWGNVAQDQSVADSFNAGYKLRQRYMVNPTEELKAELKKKGDFHLANIYRFFKVWVDKSHPLRDAIKGVVFGRHYAACLGN